MKRSEVREFVRQGVMAIRQPTITFQTGVFTDWDANRSNVYPCIFLPSLEVDTDYPQESSPPIDGWAIKLYIAYKDAMDSAPEQYEDIIDRADFIAQQLIYQYRTIIDGYKMTTIGSSSRKVWLKQNADCASGVILEFPITVSDQTDVCP